MCYVVHSMQGKPLVACQHRAVCMQGAATQFSTPAGVKSQHPESTGQPSPRCTACACLAALQVAGSFSSMRESDVAAVCISVLPVTCVYCL
jgi:hypothetical protein